MKRSIIGILLGVGLLVALAGCTGVPTSGAITEQSLKPGAAPKDVPFTAADGSRTSLSAIRKPVTIVAFTTPPGEYCCWISPELTRLSKRLWNLPVTVAQISVPTSACPHGAGCLEACSMGEHQLIALCDMDRVAWQAYGEPASGAVFLLDKNGDIVERATLANIEPVKQKAMALGEKARIEEMVEQY